MKKPPLLPLTLAAALLAVLVPQTQASNTYDIVISEETLSSQFDDIGSLAFSTVTLIPLSSLPSFTADFSTNHTFTITLSAAGGDHIIFTHPEENATMSLGIYIDGPFTVNEIQDFRLSSYTFEDAIGESPSLTADINWDNGRFMIGVKGDITETLSFSKLTINLAVDPSVTGSFNNISINRASISINTTYYDPSDYGLSDPGTSAVTIESVPEPSTWVILVGGAGVMACFDRRRKLGRRQ